MSARRRNPPQLPPPAEATPDHAAAGAARPVDPAMAALFDELRSLILMMPGRSVPPEADEADFDNMPV